MKRQAQGNPYDKPPEDLDQPESPEMCYGCGKFQGKDAEGKGEYILTCFDQGDAENGPVDNPDIDYAWYCPECAKNTRGKRREAQSTKVGPPAQSGKEGPRPIEDQVKVDGSPTAKVDHALKFFVEADEEGSTRSPLYWAMEIARAILNYTSGDSEDCYNNIITKAKGCGLTDGQKDQVDNLLVTWNVPVKVDIKDAEQSYRVPPKDILTFTPFTQKQVAASARFPTQEISKRLQTRASTKAACVKFLKQADHYMANRKAIRLSVLGGALNRRISTLLRRFSREEVSREVSKWNFPAQLKTAALKRLAPLPEPPLAGPRIILSDNLAKNRIRLAQVAQVEVAQHSDQSNLTPEQRLRLSALKNDYPTIDSPFWIVTAATEDINELAGMCEEYGYTRTGGDEYRAILASPNGDHTVTISPSTITFQSTSNPDVNYSFGANSKALGSFLRKKPSFKKKEEVVPDAAPAEAAAPVEKQQSSNSMIKQMIAEGKDDKTILDEMCRIFPFRKRQNLRGVIWLARNRPTPPRQAAKVYARLKDGRVLRASIQDDGNYEAKVGFAPELKKAIRKNGSVVAGWVAFLKPERREAGGPPSDNDVQRFEPEAPEELRKHSMWDPRDYSYFRKKGETNEGIKAFWDRDAERAEAALARAQEIATRTHGPQIWEDE